MRTKILIAAFLLCISSLVSAQFVGDASPQTTTAKPQKTKTIFTFKIGAALPLSKFGTVPERTADPQYLDGVMGATTGYFAELGLGLNLTNPDKKVGFYYFPILFSYWSTPLDWSSLGDIFSNKSIYSKPVSMLEVGQRYGVVVKPAKDMSAALYYRPGLIIPMKFEISDESGFLFAGEMSTADKAPALMMSHTVGLTFRYKFGSVSVEEYFSHPTFDITYKDPSVGVDKTEMGKIPMKLLVISLAAVF